MEKGQSFTKARGNVNCCRQWNLLLISGNGEVIESEDGIMAIGSGGNFALASGKALLKYSDLTAEDIAKNLFNCIIYLCLYK